MPQTLQRTIKNNHQLTVPKRRRALSPPAGASVWVSNPRPTDHEAAATSTPIHLSGPGAPLKFTRGPQTREPSAAGWGGLQHRPSSICPLVSSPDIFLWQKNEK